ncbi:MAG: hypothetical protein MJD61_08075 [Proteobacteria bacterium]|nr:hypothetical protein [Pseudomonadota bacterium]
MSTIRGGFSNETARAARGKRTPAAWMGLGLGLASALGACTTNVYPEAEPSPQASDLAARVDRSAAMAPKQQRSYYEAVLADAKRSEALHQRALERLSLDPRWEMQDQRIALSVAVSSTLETIRKVRERAEQVQALLEPGDREARFVALR